MRPSSRSPRPPVVASVLAGLAVVFLVVPVGALAVRAPWREMTALLWSDEARAALRLSLVCSLGATVLCLVFGVPLAWMLARTSLPGRRWVRALATLPLVFPPVVGGVALLLSFGRRGLLGRYLFSWFGIQLPFSTAGVILAETFVALPFLVLTAEAAFRSLDPRYEEVARGLGASRWMVFRRVTLPMCAPALAAGTVLSWARALGEFGATITFAGSLAGRTRTLPLEVYLSLESGRIGGAIALSLVLVAVSVAVLAGLRDRWLGLP